MSSKSRDQLLRLLRKYLLTAQESRKSQYDKKHIKREFEVDDLSISSHRNISSRVSPGAKVTIFPPAIMDIFVLCRENR